MTAKMIYLTNKEFERLSRDLNMVSGLNRINLGNDIVFMRSVIKEPKMPTLMTRSEATVMLRNNVFGLTDTGQAARWVDFFITAGMLEIKEEIHNPIIVDVTDKSPVIIKRNGKEIYKD